MMEIKMPMEFERGKERLTESKSRKKHTCVNCKHFTPKDRYKLSKSFIKHISYNNAIGVCDPPDKNIIGVYVIYSDSSQGKFCDNFDAIPPKFIKKWKKKLNNE